MQEQTNNHKTIYFRHRARASYSLTIKSSINFQNLAILLARKQSIPLASLRLVHKGKIIGNSQGLVQIANKEIVHIVNLEEVVRDSISITLKNFDSSQAIRTVSSKIKVKELICQQIAKMADLPYFYIGLVYLGKVLSPQKSLREEMVENHSELIVVNIKEYINAQKNLQRQIIPFNDPQSVSLQNSLLEVKQRQAFYPPNQEEPKQQQINQQPNQIEDRKEQTLLQKLETKEENQITSHESAAIENHFQPQLIEQKIDQLKNLSSQHKEQQHISQPEDTVAKIQQKSIHQIHQKQSQIRIQESDVNPQQKPKSEVKQQQMKPIDPPRRQDEPKLQQQTFLHDIQISQLPQITYDRFKIKFSQVGSAQSENEDHNNVTYNQEEKHSIKLVPPKKQLLGQVDLLPGDFVYIGAKHKSQTQNFLEKYLQEYKGMFQ